MNIQHINKIVKSGETVRALNELKALILANMLPSQEYSLAARLIKKHDQGEHKLKIQVLGQCTTTWLSECIMVHAWAADSKFAVFDAEYDNIMQGVLEIQPGQFDLVVLVPWNQTFHYNENYLNEITSFWENVWGTLISKQIPFVQIGFDYASPGESGYFQAAKGTGLIPAIRRINNLFREILPSSALFIDLEAVSGMVGRRLFYDYSRYFWTKQPFSDEGCAILAHHIFKAMEISLWGAKKVLVLDLDDTLWGGVVAEEGPHGIQLGDSPEGEAYREFQRYCKKLSERGILLAVASKNNINDANGPFAHNKNMLISINDIVSFKSGWYPKSQMLIEIAEELNLGLDSFVFFDDNPVERQEVREVLPQVRVIEAPDDPSHFVQVLEESLLFETHLVSAEDLTRKELYTQQKSREVAASGFTDIGSFLASLKMVATISSIDETNFARCHQLIGKTNQFNVSTRRHSESKLKSLIEHPGSITMSVTLADKFGDYGIIGVLIAIPDNTNSLEIDTFLMSCRVINRTVEHFIINHLVESARAAGYNKILMEHIPTAKNTLLKGIIPRLGFSLDTSSDHRTIFEINMLGWIQLTTHVTNFREAAFAHTA